MHTLLAWLQTPFKAAAQGHTPGNTHARHAQASHALAPPNPALKDWTLRQLGRNAPEVDVA